MMIHSGRAGPEGSTVELRRGEHVIIARVVWREGARAGLRSEDRLPVDEILSLSQSNSLRLVASEGAFIDRRKQPRVEQKDSRSTGRIMEFIGVGAIILCLALGVWAMAQQAFARPLAEVQSALSGRP